MASSHSALLEQDAEAASMPIPASIPTGGPVSGRPGLTLHPATKEETKQA